MNETYILRLMRIVEESLEIITRQVPKRSRLWELIADLRNLKSDYINDRRIIE